ncbi:trp operon repressor [Vibrio diabolicus]|jgi:TrpR family trp operon transcriptional repressor|uniref:Trp operon repressor homolog n=4 Tax=Vibrio TaxID=662 RepID=A0A0T7EGC3_9VIBR|nr:MULTISPECIES: trp operon repressor [Vibrio]MCR9497434.1 trp operon repressor [Vibrio alginolyticus]MEA3483491.1 trp operon repressor [Pseudomonadota bacterium]RCW24646.1 Trp operon repressor [Vibrio parahaemolyticus]ACY52558.1 Trp operon repressor-like protein [Vibrio antiquarius]AVF59162.1 trp operon repressor [Vibrio diabolicus]|eukprot:NODE_1908_length_1566_cov_3.196119_g1815_i0.p4 GENE.NODE_1908_length_1566_cov_3.196119_g1815_i0~~NODE_1908_length_1566_cov_3.196119_g1815_i0.p4  ORF type:complete len:103 (-),score=7.62 NODE_1908_length_1566_cov_3.196119_g1815_i0:530-838(-)
MSHEPEYKDWQQIIELIRTSMDSEQDDMLLTMLMSRDERESLISRVNIINELLKGELSQRQISQMLGVGIATITRGSNELKSKSDEEKDKLKVLLEQVAVSK